MPESLQLAVGDRVVYPNQGLCHVTEIKQESIAGQQLVFVSLVFEETGAKVKVPQDKLVKNGVRRVSTAADVKGVFEFLRSDSQKASLNWKERARDNTERLTAGGLLGLAEIVKGLQVLSELRPLPPKERGQYNEARHLFVTELAAALACTLSDAEDALDIVLFPVGKERPKRSAEEFKALGGEDDELGMADDLGGLDGEAPAEEEQAEESSEDGGDEDGEEKPAADAPKKRGRPPKAKADEKPKKAALSDVETTLPQGTPLAPPLPKKRGRPPKVKPPEADAATAPPAADEPPPAPKKRGRPPKAKPPETEAAPEPPRKRGRPPKAKP